MQWRGKAPHHTTFAGLAVMRPVSDFSFVIAPGSL
jgi:hypothetical protein